MTQKTFYLDIFHAGGHAVTFAETTPPVPEQDYRRYAITVMGQQLTSIAVSGSKVFAMLKNTNGQKVEINACDALQAMIPRNMKMIAVIGRNWGTLDGNHNPVFKELIDLMRRELPFKPMQRSAA
jgi:hypothetical protein